ncbi:hypothetical protein [Clostridium oryzae]|uniref:Phage DNA packaging protein Nu1 n=1 Tax=Clostridium oryzae TaxID=1450648 RepID=A0A1V4IVE4_9CLOT|nr:hypothetical protein [Clostridium oryzae]OPJ63387.1 hypothetical protein CLORY_11690 [Clostridium oryzae]
MTEGNKKIESVDSVVVSSSVLADLFGLTDRRIRTLAEEGILKKISRGRYDLFSSIRNYIIYLKTQSDLKEDKTEKSIDYDMEHALLERAKREKVELELTAMKGTMHLSEDVERVMNDMLANFRAKLLSLPTKIAPLLAGKEDISEIQQLLQNDFYEILHEFSFYNPEDFYSEKYINIDEVTNEANIYQVKEINAINGNMQH